METTHGFRTFNCANCGHELRIPVRCGDRFCPVCSKSAASKTRKRLNWLFSHVEKRKNYNWKFITLTLKSSDDLALMVGKLIADFRRLRNRKFWTNAIDGGAYVIELTHGVHGWHAHLHIIAFGQFIPQRFLSRQWNGISGSPIVDIRKADPRDLTTYVTKYITKFEIPEGRRWEALHALDGRRLWSPFGILHDLNCQYVPEPSYCTDCGCSCWTCLDFAHWTDDTAS